MATSVETGDGAQAGAEAALALPVDLPAEMFTGPGLMRLADALPVMIGYVDREFRLAFINQPMADWFDLPRSEVTGARIVDLIGERRLAQRMPNYRRALDGERVFFVNEFEHPTRGSVALKSDYMPWLAADGSVSGFVVIQQDVTEQRTAERALRESEARFRRIANSAPVMMWVTRIDRVRDFVNDAYADYVCGPDCAPDEARTIDWKERIHPDDVERVVGESLAGEASGQPFTLEARYQRHDGEYRWLRSVSSPRHGPDGTLVGFIGVATDITLAKEAELELRRQVLERTAALAESEARFRAIFDTVLEVIVLLAPDGTIVEMNRKDAIWRAGNFDDAIGGKIWDAPTLQMYPQHRALLKRAVKAAAGGDLFSSQVSMERLGVPTAYLDVSMQPVEDRDGDVKYLLFEARDITELRSAQEQLRQSQKMEALGQLTGGIAHDFNNLLTVVVGGLDLVAKRVEDAKLKRYATNALTAAERGARLTGQLLAFSRVQRLEVRPVHVAPLIENMRPLLKNVLGPGITKHFDLDKEQIPVMADPTQLEVAVLNLAINARDAMPAGGTLSFESRACQVSGDPELEDGDYIELCISDTGTGMPAEVVTRAFEPFFTTKEVGKGTGLGLSMVYGMARQSGGTARIESTPGEGTAVKLFFRSAKDAAPAIASDEERDTDDAQAKTASVLVIDDDTDVRGFIAEALEDEDYRVRECADGRSGLTEYARARPDLVVLDFVMPEMSGADVAREILAQQPDQKILFVSGYSETDAIKRIAPGAPLLSKPFRAEALSKAVRRALSEG
ncbi:PAS domain S-box protein [Sphingomonas sinipercae]|uniref:histidine kinase n=1 Tax=Sphingomonas sinipercae TaxID=2714944 RepID=A0A6G7ZLG6_9SPHN|nr:PAS domain S-box protein [Sphingomonas sinipercae]QIL01837.1 PAS domain S-box protein [Sphingomonas sinipercae]